MLKGGKRQIVLSSDVSSYSSSDNENVVADVISVINNYSFTNETMNEDSSKLECTYAAFYECGKKGGTKGQLKQCNSKKCNKLYHKDCVKIHVEWCKGIHHSNQETYMNICLSCFNNKVQHRTTFQIGQHHHLVKVARRTRQQRKGDLRIKM
eukprot:12619555-Ditylum_brightwellii.AAC.1